MLLIGPANATTQGAQIIQKYKCEVYFSFIEIMHLFRNNLSNWFLHKLLFHFQVEQLGCFLRVLFPDTPHLFVLSVLSHCWQDLF